MAKRNNLVRRIIGEMSGKVGDNPSSIWSRMISNSLRPNVTTTDYNRNDYDLFRAVYHNSVVNGQGREYQIAAALGKPVVNITAGYVVGNGFRIQISNPDNSPLISEAEDEINRWLLKNRRAFFNIARHGYRDGDAYLHIDEFGELTELDAKGVEEKLDPLSGKTIGFDVRKEVKVESTTMDGGFKSTSENWIYLKQYRTDSTRILRFRKGQEDRAEILWERVYTRNGASPLQRDENKQVIGLSPSEIQERRLAVKAFHNEPEPEAVYGNSDYQNLLNLFANYSDLITHGTRGAKYNAVPVPVLRGVKDPSKMEVDPAEEVPEKHDTDEKGVEWGKDKVIYLEGEHADAKMLQGNDFMGDIGKLLEYYFYLFVQGSETPEFALGTAISSSKASAETQSPVLGKKIDRKRLEFEEFITDVVETYIERRILMSDPMYFVFRDNTIDLSVEFPELGEEDKKTTFEIVEWAFTNGLMTSEKALGLIIGDKVKDVPAEIRNAALEVKKKAEQNPTSSDRLVRELLGSQTTPATTAPDKSEEPEE